MSEPDAPPAPPGRGDAAAELEGLLYAGEELLDEAPVGGAHVAVTSHRVLALTPDGDGPRFQEAARPNVTGAAVRASGRAAAVRRTLRAGVYAAVLLGGGFFVDLEGFVQPVDPPSGTGVGGVISLVNAMIGLLALLDDALLVGGLLASAVALAFLGRYLHSREQFLEIDVAGGEPLRVPVERDRSGAAERIEAAVEKASNASTA